MIPEMACDPFPGNVLALAERDAQLQGLMPIKGASLYSLDHPPAYVDLLESLFAAYAERPALASRSYVVGLADASQAERVFLPQFSALTYAEIQDRVRRLAMAWREPAAHRVDPGELVCIIGSTGNDFVTIDLACAYAQAISVPLHAASSDELDAIIATTSPSVVAASIADLVTVATLSTRHPSIRSIIAFDFDSRVGAERADFDAAQRILSEMDGTARLLRLDDLLQGRDASQWHRLPETEEGLDRVAVLIHSSGSTGTPKGVILSERLAQNIWAPGAAAPVVRMAYAPMSHMMGRAMVYGALARGGTAYFTARPDLSELFADIRLVRPTELAMLPRLLDMVYRHYLGEVSRAGGEDDEEVAVRVCEEMGRSFLGDRLCAISYASAPVAPEVAQFISRCFSLPLASSYGMTEAGAILVNGRVARPPVQAYRLRDVPALGYFASDKPFPRGELCIKSRSTTPGYFRQPDLTSQLFDEDGFLRTGDVFEEHGPDQLAYLERANDVLKLAQGEFVAIGALAGTYEANCPSIEQIYVHCNSAWPYLLAVVIPRHLDRRLQDDEAALKAEIRSDILRAAKAKGLAAAEIPRDFIIDDEPFSFANGLLTSLGKRRRPALKARYADRLDRLYEEIERRRRLDLQTLVQSGAHASVRDRLVQGLAASLGVEVGGIDPSLCFADLGGDSLGAVDFATMLTEMFEVEVPANAILSPAGSVDAWTQMIERALADLGGRQLTFTDIHGAQPSGLHARDLDIQAFLGRETFQAAPAIHRDGEPSSVLLTGTTGFLGRFLCLAWLERMEQRGGRLTCIVRAPNMARAHDRLASEFASDPALASRFAALAERHLDIVVGDVAEPSLGLSPETFDRLGHEVDHIVHCGALVNHVLPYQQLFAANVAGTAELVRLALTHRQKSFDFISSLAVVGLCDQTQGAVEAAPLAASVPLSNAHARGYALSKWAGEQVLHSASRRFGLPLRIFRCDMILGDRRFDGQINITDSFSRLLMSVILTGIAPKSFYELADDGSVRPGHYDGLPADFVAAAITGIGAGSSNPRPKVFHVMNHHRMDGCSLDSFVSWIADAGHPIEWIDDFDDWHIQFEARLRSLPEHLQERSALPLLAAFKAPSKPACAMHVIDSSAFISAVREEMCDQIPHVDRALIVKYLADLRLLGLIGGRQEVSS